MTNKPHNEYLTGLGKIVAGTIIAGGLLIGVSFIPRQTIDATVNNVITAVNPGHERKDGDGFQYIEIDGGIKIVADYDDMVYQFCEGDICYPVPSRDARIGRYADILEEYGWSLPRIDRP